MTHELKSHPMAFQARWRGVKTWEFRFNDRNFQEGDNLHEREWMPAMAGNEGYYTGRSILSLVTYVRQGGVFGIPKEACVMSVVTLAWGKAP